MKAIQRINHNAAICEDGAGRQLIALGRGIGFGEMPHEVDLDVVTRTFYGIDSKYLAFIDEVDPEVLEFSAQLADIATGCLLPLAGNLSRDERNRRIYSPCVGCYSRRSSERHYRFCRDHYWVSVGCARGFFHVDPPGNHMQ